MNISLGARNTVGFTQSVKTELLPSHTHLTYQGVFNEIKYNMGPKTDKIVDLHYGYSRFQFSKSKFDNQINDYLALFLKGKADGQDRAEDVRLNLVICLDVSGSMSCVLKAKQNKNDKHKTRLSLSLQAIKMLISKLKSNDSIGLVVFSDQAETIFECSKKKNISTADIFQRIDKIHTDGGTTIIKGFKKSNQMLQNWIKKTDNQGKCQNRVVMLTDVCDEGLSQQREIVKNAAQMNIHTSIIGISTNFKSQACEVFKDIKGFNYFCAVDQDDIQKYVFETFDFGFFPSSNNICIDIESQNIADIEVYGTPDCEKVKEYNFKKEKNNWTISKIKSCFPSEIQVQGDTVYTYGGLILVKLKRVIKESNFNGTINLSYEDLQGKKYSQKYMVHFQFHPEEQFFSGDQLRQAIQGFFFTSELKQILKESSKLQGYEIYQKYWEMLTSLETLCPKSKLKQFEDIKTIVKRQQQKKELMEVKQC